MSNQYTSGPWTAMRKPRASFSDHGWRSMAMCGAEWMVAAPASATRRVEGGVIVQSLWDNEANCRRIVQCVNSHDELVAAATEFLTLNNACAGADRLRAALSKATGES